jgi:hypothetical protein
MLRLLDKLIGPRPPCKCGGRMVPVRRGYPVYVCKCGSMKFGDRTVTLDGVLDLIRWTTSGTPTVAGEVGMDLTTGRPRAFVFNASQVLGVRDESIIPSAVRAWAIQQNGGLTTIAQVGFATAPTATGTASVLNTSTAQFINYVSGAVAGNEAGWVSSAFSQTRRDYLPTWRGVIRTGSTLTNIRHWFGLFSATPATADDPAINGAGFRYSTAVDGTAFWRAWTNDGAGGGAVTATTVAVTADTIYRFMVVLGAASVLFFIDDVLVATHVADLPAAATNLGHVERITTLDAVAKNVSISKVSLNQRAA